jgi:hypothetical protein
MIIILKAVSFDVSPNTNQKEPPGKFGRLEVNDNSREIVRLIQYIRRPSNQFFLVGVLTSTRTLLNRVVTPHQKKSF